MRKQAINRAIYAAAGVGLFSLVSQAKAGFTVDGTLDAGYGPPLSVQTVNTGFGDSTVGNGTSAGGSELDGAYANVSNGTLYLFFSGNVESNGNHFNLFISDGRAGGQNILSASTSSGNLSGSNGLTFPTGFNATYALDTNFYGPNNAFYVDQYDLVHNTANYLGSVSTSSGIGNGVLSGIGFGLNDTNAAGVNGSTGTAADPTAASAVSTGWEFSIPLAALGYPSGQIQVIADINNTGNSYLSNQFLPGLPVGYGNLQGPSSTNLNGEVTPLTITIPATPNGVWLATGSGSWATGGNWSNGVVPGGAGSSVTFASATADSAITLDGTYTTGSLTLNSSFAYNISGGSGGVLKLDNGTSAASITSYSGNQTISAPVMLNSNTTVTAASHGSTITLSGNISGVGGLTVFDQGAGGASPSEIILSGSNNYSGGTTVSGGNLQLGSASALPAGSALTLNAVDVPAGVLDLNGYSASLSSVNVLTGPNTQSLGAVGKIINTRATAGNTVLTYAGSTGNPSTFGGIISDNAGSGGASTTLLVTSGSLTLTNSNSYAGGTNVSGGTVNLGAVNALPAGGNLTIGSGGLVVATNLGTENAITVGSLSVAGKLDLNNNGLIIQNGTTTAVNTLLHNGFKSGGWNGTSGIVSSTAAGDSSHLTTLGMLVNDSGAGTSTPYYGSGGTIASTFDGATPADGNILLKYTYYGDTNLDGVVDGTDYSRIDTGYLNHLTGWFNGDLNYDNVIDGSDYTLIDNAYNQQGAALSALLANPSASVTAQIAGQFGGGASAVPEPATLSLLAFGTACLLGRRRRYL
jgi:autotransporter-associated beta strand protein